MDKLALLGGIPVRTRPWPVWPVAGPEERRQLEDVLEAANGTERPWGGLLPGPKAAQLEDRFAAYHGCRYGVAVSSGVAALEIALYAIGLDLGDEVICTPLSWVASANCVLRAGGVPVFVDVEDRTYAIDPDLIEAAITPRTRAVLPVHLGGYPAQIERIVQLASRHSLAVIEDCAQAHGSLRGGKPVGSFGQASCFSFQNSKLMSCGEGGMVLTSDEDIWQRCHSYKDCGRLRGASGYIPSRAAFEQGGWGFGWNYRLTEFQAALLLAQFERMEAHKEIRMANARWLAAALREIGGIEPLEIQDGQNVYRFFLKYSMDDFNGLSLDRFIAAVQAEGVPLQHFPLPPLPEEGLYQGYLKVRAGSPGLLANPKEPRPEDFQVARRAYLERLVFLHHNLLLSPMSEMEDIVGAIAKVKRNAEHLRSATP
jgi:dTDP-4-amino-4,6-dideoxygalactose transaminase